MDRKAPADEVSQATRREREVARAGPSSPNSSISSGNFRSSRRRSRSPTSFSLPIRTREPALRPLICRKISVTKPAYDLSTYLASPTPAELLAASGLDPNASFHAQERPSAPTKSASRESDAVPRKNGKKKQPRKTADTETYKSLLANIQPRIARLSVQDQPPDSHQFKDNPYCSTPGCPLEYSHDHEAARDGLSVNDFRDYAEQVSAPTATETSLSERSRYSKEYREREDRFQEDERRREDEKRLQYREKGIVDAIGLDAATEFLGYRPEVGSKSFDSMKSLPLDALPGDALEDQDIFDDLFPKTSSVPRIVTNGYRSGMDEVDYDLVSQDDVPIEGPLLRSGRITLLTRESNASQSAKVLSPMKKLEQGVNNLSITRDPTSPVNTSVLPCTDTACPIAFEHLQGRYLHHGEVSRTYNDRWGYSDPPQSVWEAWAKVERRTASVGDEVLVDAFAELHRWVGL
ncbi:hypothetical protein MMC28_003269 [Mycoblastus sanguinarius]|nr:hypothetical protein [Mycoblastus sanguinarius]